MHIVLKVVIVAVLMIICFRYNPLNTTGVQIELFSGLLQKKIQIPLMLVWLEKEWTLSE